MPDTRPGCPCRRTCCADPKVKAPDHDCPNGGIVRLNEYTCERCYERVCTSCKTTCTCLLLE